MALLIINPFSSPVSPFDIEVVLFLCETSAFLRSERRTDVALDSNQDGGVFHGENHVFFPWETGKTHRKTP
jgi:hypothetical protein